MPQFLKTDSIRLFESSVQSIRLAILGLSTFQDRPLRQEMARYAPVIGIVGTSAELAMSACLVQKIGQKVINKNEKGRFKTFGQIINDFCSNFQIIDNNSFILKNISDTKKHTEELVNLARHLTWLSIRRAGGFHAGKGARYEECLAMINKVVLFLTLLSKSTKIKPYIEPLPKCPENPKNQIILIEDLIKKVKETNIKNTEKISYLFSSIYLMLPFIPKEEPVWLSDLEHTSVAPSEYDINVLLDSLNDSTLATLRKTKGKGTSNIVPAVIDKNNPESLPITPHHLKTTYTTYIDRFYADIATANGRLDENTLDLPPIKFVYTLFEQGLYETNILEAPQGLTAPQAWPFIASSLAISGTPGPYWFLLKLVSDFGSLKSKLEKAKNLSKYLENNLSEALYAINLLRRKKQEYSKYFNKFYFFIERAEHKRTTLIDCVQKNINTPRELPNDLENLLKKNTISIKKAIISILESSIHLDKKKYWSKKFCEMATKKEDINGINAILNHPELNCSKTEARKALRRLDFHHYGFKIK